MKVTSMSSKVLSKDVRPQVTDESGEIIPQPNRLGVSPVGKLLTEYAFPSILATCVGSLYNVIDTIFIGHYVGDLGIAATTVILPGMLLLGAFSMWLGAGGNAAAAIKLGEGRSIEANRYLSNTFSLLMLIALVVTVIGMIFIKPILYFCGATPENYDYSYQFMMVLLAGFVLQAPGLGLNNFIRTDGKPLIALFTMLTGCVVNILLNVVFVAWMGWGVFGSALATVIGQAATSFFVVGYFCSRHASMRLRRSLLRLSRPLVLSICGLGGATFALQAASAAISLFLNAQIAIFGAVDPLGVDGGLATLGTVNKIVMLFIMPIIGMSIAMQPLVGFNYGAHNYHRVRHACFVTLGFSIALTSVFWLYCHINPEPVVRLFGLPDQYIEFSVKALKTFTIFMPIIPIQVIGANYFQSTGQPLKAAVLSLTRQIILLLPLLYILPRVLPNLLGISPLSSIVFVTPMADSISATVVLFFLVRELKRLKVYAHNEGMKSEQEEVARMYALALERSKKQRAIA